jgi:hypothetical protein
MSSAEAREAKLAAQREAREAKLADQRERERYSIEAIASHSREKIQLCYEIILDHFGIVAAVSKILIQSRPLLGYDAYFLCFISLPAGGIYSLAKGSVILARAKSLSIDNDSARLYWADH